MMDFQRIPLLPACVEVAAALHSASGLVEAWSADAFGQLLTLHGVAGQIFTVEDTPAGVILWRIILDEAEILTVAVSQEYRRRGVGRILLEDAFVAMRNGCADSVFLEVAIDNQPALNLYKSMGFAEAGRRKGYYRTACGLTDALILFRQLSK